MIANREQAEKVMQQYVSRNTPKRGKDKGKTPLWGDLMEFVSEIVVNFSISYNMALTNAGEKVTIEQVMNTIISRSAYLFTERLDELKGKGISIDIIDSEGNEVEVDSDPDVPVDVEYEVVDDE